jgi:vitamin B12 transporter
MNAGLRIGHNAPGGKCGLTHLVFLLAVAGCLASGRAQTPGAEKDSATLVLPGLTVIGTRTAYYNQYGTLQYQADSLGNFATAGLGLAAALQGLQGAYLQDYGGHGGIKTLSIRGFATNQTTVSIAGIPLSNSQLGVVNLANFYLSAFGRVEVRSTAGGLVQNAQAGNVDLQTGNLHNRLKLQLATGSYGARDAALSLNRTRTRHELDLGYHYSTAQDNYPYRLDEATGTRQHAEYQNQQGLIRYRYLLSEKASLEYLGLGYRNRQNIPQPIVKGVQPSTSGPRLEQDLLFHYLQYRHQSAPQGGRWRRSGALSAKQQFDNMNVQPDQWYQNQNYLAQADYSWQYQATAHSLHSLQAVAQLQYDHLRSNNLADAEAALPTTQRIQANLGLAYQGLSQIGQAQRPWLLSHRLSYRHNSSTDYGPLPNLSLELRLSRGQQLVKSVFAHGTSGYRLPTFNELYFRNFGNPSLQAEHTRQLDLGLALKHPRWFVQLTGFVNETRSKIVSIPLSPVRWSTLGLGLTESLGLELAAEWNPSRHWQLHYTYTRMEARDRSVSDGALLPYTPQELIRTGITATYGRISAGGQLSHVGWRFSSLQASALTYLPPYTLVDAWLRYTHPLPAASQAHYLQLGLSGQNLLDESYAVIRAFPMPGRTWLASLAFIW